MATALPIVETESDLRSLARQAAEAPRVALDLEANGRFAYRARVSTIQLAFGDTIAIVDPLAPGLAGRLEPLAELLSSQGPVKVVHDVGFDARLLAEAGLRLGNVHDTALTAQWLGRPATGLASLALAELGVTLDKSLQAQDWGKRPLDARSLRYLADDVSHLLPLEERLWGEAVAAAIVEELDLETTYRLTSAERAVLEPDPRPAYTRAKGVDGLPASDLAVFRRVFEARESEAARLDSSAGELVPTAVLLAMAKSRPTTARELARIKSPIARVDASAVADALLRAVAQGIADGEVPEAERAALATRRLPPAVVKSRRDREARISAWRKAEAKARAVNEQVVLPGHCASDVVGLERLDHETLAQVPGIGRFRVSRYGDAILAALAEPVTP